MNVSRSTTSEFELQLTGFRQTGIKIYYWLPDHPLILQEFTWQTSDQPPKFNRIRRFLKYWDEHIEASIKEIFLHVAHGLGPVKYSSVEHFVEMHE